MIRGDVRSSRNSLVLLGAGSQARVLLDMLDEADRLDDVAGLVDVVDEEPYLEGPVRGKPVLGTWVDRNRWKEDLGFDENPVSCVPAIGDNSHRRELQETFTEEIGRAVTTPHPSAVISSEAEVERGCCIHAGGVVGVSASLGKGVIVNTNASVDHDCEIGDYCHIAPGATLTGDVKLGDEVMIGAGATVAPGTRIGDGSFLEAGALAHGEYPEGSRISGT